MPVSKWIGIAFLTCLCVLLGCPASTPQCPQASVTPGPIEIPEGASQATLAVSVDDINPDIDLEILTELTAGKRLDQRSLCARNDLHVRV